MQDWKRYANMSFGDIGKSFERLMRCTNNLCETAEPNTKGAGHAYAESFRSANESWQRLEVVMQKATDNAPARAWLSAHLERKLFFRLEMLFITIRENAEVATGSSTNATARCGAAIGAEFQFAEPLYARRHAGFVVLYQSKLVSKGARCSGCFFVNS